MQKLGQISLKSTVTVQMSCNLNDDILIKNFGIITECLAQLSRRQDTFERQLREISGLGHKFNDLNEKFNRTSVNTKLNNTTQGSKNQLDETVNKDAHTQQSKNYKESSNQGKVHETHHQKNNRNDSLENDRSDERERNQSKESFASKQDMNEIISEVKKLKERVSRNGQNIDGNIKDINSINKDITEIRELLSALGKNLQSPKNVKTDQSQKGAKFEIGSIRNIQDEVSKNKEKIEKLNEDLQKMRERISQNEKDIEDLKKEQPLEDKNTSINSRERLRNLGGDTDKQSTLLTPQVNDLRDKINALTILISDNIQETKRHANEIESIQNESEISRNQNEERKKEIESLREEISRIAKELQNMQSQNENNTKNLKGQLLKLKKDGGEKSKKNGFDQQGNSEHNKLKSNTSLDEDLQSEKNGKSGLNKNAIYTQNRFNSNQGDNKEALRQLKDRVDMLEKLMGGSRNNVGQERSNPEKLPVIKRPFKAKQRGQTQQRSSHYPKKDMSEIKTEIQAWVKNFYEQGKQKDNMEGLELQIQEMRNILNRKADQQGMKKGLSFLQNKITQLYLFLTEPDTEDAMIVRKGFNCLSCSKKVEKLRGKLGPHINWNNMTQTNYSPPRVGYSKPMGENSIDKDDQ